MGQSVNIDEVIKQVNENTPEQVIQYLQDSQRTLAAIREQLKRFQDSAPLLPDELQHLDKCVSWVDKHYRPMNLARELLVQRNQANDLNQF